MSFKDELNAIKDTKVKAKPAIDFEGDEYMTALAKKWVDTWVEIELKNIRAEMKTKAENGDYEKHGDHNVVHVVRKLYDESCAIINEYSYMAERPLYLVDYLNYDEFYVPAEASELYNKKNGLSSTDIEIKTFDIDDYDIKKYPEDHWHKKGLFLKNGRGIKFVHRYKNIQKSNAKGFFKEIFGPSKEDIYYEYHFYESLIIGDIGQYIINRFKNRASENGLKVDFYATGSFPKGAEYKRFEIEDLKNECYLGSVLIDNNCDPTFYFKIDFSIEF